MTRTRQYILLPLLFLIVALTGCNPIAPTAGHDIDTNKYLHAYKESTTDKFTPASLVERISEEVPEEYVIGEGDVLSIQVWHRPEVSAPSVLVAPDGVISLPRLGEIPIAGKTRQQATEAITESLKTLYADPEVTLTVSNYNNNKAYVLGRVARPGILHFPGKGTLLEAITMAGGIPGLSDNIYPTELSIMRGKDKIIWIDVNELLLNGNLALNARIQNGDMIFVPAAKQRLVYLVGEVRRPGAMTLSPGLTFLDAIMQSGGPTEDADLQESYLVRWENGKSIVKEIDLADVLARGDLTQDYVLKDKDVVIIKSKAIARFNYYIRQVTPSLRLIDTANRIQDVVEDF